MPRLHKEAERLRGNKLNCKEEGTVSKNVNGLHSRAHTQLAKFTSHTRSHAWPPE